MTGCAFAILLSHYCKYGGESGNMLANYANFGKYYFHRNLSVGSV